MNGINERLKQIRQNLGLSQQKLADSLELQRSIIADVERGKVKSPNFKLLRKLEEKYNINPDWLLTGEGEMYKAPNNVQNAIIAQGSNHNIVGNIIGNNVDNELKELCEAFQKLPEKKRKYFYHLIMAEVYKEEE